jgi:hypothetical protein
MGRVFRFAQPVVLCVGTLLMVTVTLSAQEAPATPDSSAPHIGIPEDWSTQRVIYTHNGSVGDMMKVRNDPRFLNSFLLHNMREHGNQSQPPASDGSNEFGLNENSSGEDNSTADAQAMQPQLPVKQPKPRPTPRPKNKHTKVDWAVSLGPTYGMAIGESPAKYTFNPSAAPSCSDFIVFSLKAAATVGGQANLVGLTNLYSAAGTPTPMCGTTPTFLFSYAIGTGPSYLSPVLSLSGKKVAWIETRTVAGTGHAYLHVTTFVAGQGTSATTAVAPTGTFSSGACTPAGSSCDVAIDYTGSAYSGCTASVNSNTNSEIYVDYSSDTAFLGADNGILYHVKGIFTATPTFDFCIPVNTTAGVAMSGPVYDSLLNEVFITDSTKIYAYTVGATSYTLKTSYPYGTGTLTGPGPLLDAFNNFIYVFSASDVATPTHHTSVTQLPTGLAAGSAVVVPLGPASTNAYPILFYGTFDNNYFTFGPKNSKSTLYSCGTDTNTTAQDLFAISFNPSTGLMNTTPAMPANNHVDPGTLNGTCSPITEFYDGTTDRIFVGMGEHLATTGANVVQMWNVTTQLTSASDTYSAQATSYLGGSSGLIIDNNASGTAQAESVYFTTLAANGTSPGICGANNYCAVKLTQGLLH